MSMRVYPRGRDPARIDRVLGTIRKIWTDFPDLRLLQLLLAVVHAGEDPFYLEDDELERRLREFFELQHSGI